MRQRAWDVLADDRPPSPPFQAQEADDERWTEAQLEADLLMGKRWPFFRDKRFDPTPPNEPQQQEAGDNQES